MPEPSFWLASATFSDGTAVKFNRSDITVIVGANNSGKSESLRNIREKITAKSSAGIVTRDIIWSTEGTTEDLLSWIQTSSRRMPGNPDNPAYNRGGGQVHVSQIRSLWPSHPQGLGPLAPFFCYHLSTDERLTAASPAPNIAMTTDALSNPIHYLYADDSIEKSISAEFREAFGQDLVVHRSAGNLIPLYCGLKPNPQNGQDRLSIEYVRELEKLSPLHKQGDGMRAFVGILLHTLVMRHSILLIDEPEAFLHPPQIRQLARLIATALPKNQQVFVATHSGDFLRGMLDAESERVRILRLSRSANINHVKELDNESIKAFWSDSLLRYSNILV